MVRHRPQAEKERREWMREVPERRGNMEQGGEVMCCSSTHNCRHSE